MLVKKTQYETGTVYRTPWPQVAKKDQEVQGPRPVSTIGGGRGGCLMSFSQAAGVASGR
jgi:hypothetical protein